MFILKPLMAIIAICALLVPTRAEASSSNIEEYDEKAVCSNKCHKEYYDCEAACYRNQQEHPAQCMEMCNTKLALCKIMACDVQATTSYFYESSPVFWEEMCGLTCKWRRGNYHRKP